MGCGQNATIQQIHLELAIARAQKEFQEELEDRAHYERLKRSY